MPHLVCTAHVPTHAITHGFLPAARRLGLEFTLLTDQVEQNTAEFASRPPELRPDRIVAADVFHPVAILDALTREHLRADAIFSNSDHLQTATAMAAQALGLPGKQPGACYAAKHKGEMRRRLQQAGVESIRFWQFRHADELAAAELPFPCVAKPCKGVASLEVQLVRTPQELQAAGQQFWSANPHRELLVEEFLPGTIYSVETLGDGQECRVLGGFTCSLCELPYFIETGASWGLGPMAQQGPECVVRALEALGATWGACHTEIVATPDGPRIIEVNYRSIGDGSDFMLHHLLGDRYFDAVLQVHLGQPLQLPPVAAEAHSVARYLFAERAGVLAHVPDGFQRHEQGFDIHYVPQKKTEEMVKLTHSNKDYLAMLHVTGPGTEAVELRLDQLARQVGSEIRWC